MSNFPTLISERLRLRAFMLEDAEAVVDIAGDFKVADTTAFIPHPYNLDDATAWIMPQPREYEQGWLITWAITHKDTGAVMGMVSLRPDFHYSTGELGYWLGPDFWHQGFCTEAAKGVLMYAFDRLQLHRVEAFLMHRNQASAKVLEKLGFQLEGTKRQGMLKWGRYEDLDYYGLLESEYHAQRFDNGQASA
ncbi:MAG TPA: GNAT family N-acetyltransferase [Opitutales bacterium]|nr:GNAT family N-acetyltransferase [Opitutales bacterium]